MKESGCGPVQQLEEGGRVWKTGGGGGGGETFLWLTCEQAREPTQTHLHTSVLARP